MPISFGVVIGDWLFNKDSTHAKDEDPHWQTLKNNLEFAKV
jgi:hypothetical protein